MADEKDLPIQDRLDQIREAGGSVKMDGDNLTRDADTSNGAAQLQKLFLAGKKEFFKTIREKLDDANFEANYRRKMNSDPLQSRKMPAHPDVEIDTAAEWVSLDWHQCKNKKCCAD